MADPVDVAYLAGMYDQGADPWGISTGFYEQRKRQLVLDSLTRQRYSSAFEPGCSNGALTELLAGRCDRLLSVDLSQVAVDTAADRVSAYPHVQVAQLLLPRDWPDDSSFDLVVLSEIGYFFNAVSWAEFCARIPGSLSDDATVVACHWRHDFAQRALDTASVHAELAAALGLRKELAMVDEDFVIDVWSTSTRTVAERQGLYHPA